MQNGEKIGLGEDEFYEKGADARSDDDLLIQMSRVRVLNGS